jgi:hypothetical protein
VTISVSYLIYKTGRQLVRALIYDRGGGGGGGYTTTNATGQYLLTQQQHQQQQQQQQQLYLTINYMVGGDLSVGGIGCNNRKDITDDTTNTITMMMTMDE